MESDSICGKDAVVNASKVICIRSMKKEIMVPGCSDVLEGGARWISCVAYVIE